MRKKYILPNFLTKEQIIYQIDTILKFFNYATKKIEIIRLLVFHRFSK